MKKIGWMQYYGRSFRCLPVWFGLFFLISGSGWISGCRFFEEVTREEAPEASPIVLLEQRVQKVESGLDRVGREIRKQETVLRSEYASLKAEVAGLRSDLQSLLGELEKLTYQLDRHVQTFERSRNSQDERIASLTRNIVGRIAVIENYLGFKRSAESWNIIGDKPPTAEDSDSEEALYKTALQLLEVGNYEAARRSFEQLLESRPESALCDNARFWIGESYYREHWYEKAILEYQKVIDDYPQGNKVPAALLKQGLAFNRIEDDTSARQVLNKLIKSFPGSNEAGIAEKKLNEM